MPRRKPWEVHSDLSDDRLIVVGKLLAEVREEALEDFNPERGDGAWGHGCRVYERSCARLVQAAESFEWLEVIESSLHFVFAVGRVPIRFYHGVPESPRQNSLWRTALELEQQQQAFEFLDRDDDGWFWRVAVVSDTDGRVAEVVMFQARESGAIRYQWSIPLDEPVSVLAGLGSISEPVELSPAEVGVLLGDEEIRDEAGDR